MKLSIIVPVYNEKSTIEKVLDKLISLKIESIEKEIIIVDYGSTDGTSSLLKLITIPQSKVVYHLKNKGKGAAIRTALKHVTGTFFIIQDADLEYDIGDYNKLLIPILEGNANVVYGSRFLKSNPVIYRYYYLGNKLLSFCISILYRSQISDAYTCYKLIKTEILKNIELVSRGFEIEAEITAKLLRKGFKIVEVPISYEPRTLEAGKKIKFKDAFIGMYVIFKNRFF